MSDFEMIEEEYETVTLELDDGSEEEFAIVDELEVEGQKYVLLSLVLEDDTISEEYDDMLFMRDETDATCEDGEIVLTVIEDDEEYDKVVDAYTEEEE